MLRQLALIVNRGTGTAHLYRDCEAIVCTKDRQLRIEHASASALPPLRYCHRCFDFQVTAPDDPADVTAVLHETAVLSRREAPTPEGG